MTDLCFPRTSRLRVHILGEPQQMRPNILYSNTITKEKTVVMDFQSLDHTVSLDMPRSPDEERDKAEARIAFPFCTFSCEPPCPDPLKPFVNRWMAHPQCRWYGCLALEDEEHALHPIIEDMNWPPHPMLPLASIANRFSPNTNSLARISSILQTSKPQNLIKTSQNLPETRKKSEMRCSDSINPERMET